MTERAIDRFARMKVADWTKLWTCACGIQRISLPWIRCRKCGMRCCDD